MSAEAPKQLKDLTFDLDVALPLLLSQLESLPSPPSSSSSTSSITTSASSSPPSSSSSSPSTSAILPPAFVDEFLNLEKKCRLAADARSSCRLVVTVLSAIFKTSSNFPSGSVPFLGQVCELMNIISKRRAQLQKVVETLVIEGVKLLELIPELFTSPRRDLIETLRTISMGKMFVELERARLTKQLAKMEEDKGEVSAAAEIIQEVQVETIGTMEIREKLEFFLYQIQLCLNKKDFVRAEIIAKKVDPKTLNAKDLEDLKIAFYRLQIQYFTHSAAYFSIAMAWREILNCPSTQEQPKKWQEAMENCVLYGVLSPWDSELSDYLHRLKDDKKMPSLTAFKNLLDHVTGTEIMMWPLAAEKHFREHRNFKEDLIGDTQSTEAPAKASSSSAAMEDVDDSSLSAASPNANNVLYHNKTTRWTDFHKRVIQHNLRVIARFYSHVRMSRLASLLNLTEAETEAYLSELVSSKQLFARMDRPVGIVSFEPKANESVILQSWADDIHALLNKIQHTQHLINKENMVHKIK